MPFQHVRDIHGKQVMHQDLFPVNEWVSGFLSIKQSRFNELLKEI